MRNLTYLLIVPFIFFFSPLHANDIDLGIEKFEFANSNDELRIGIIETLSTSVKNYSDDGVPEGTQIYISGSINGEEIFSDDVVIQQSIAPGDSIDLSRILRIPEMEEGEAEVCLWTENDEDIDNSNDTSCNTYNIVTYERDLGIDRLRSPEDDTLDLYADYGYAGVIRNYSSESFENTIISIGMHVINNETNERFNLSIGGSDRFPVDMRESSIGGNSETNITPIQINLSNLDFEEGSYDICLETYLPEVVDPNPDNNAGCRTFYYTEDYVNISEDILISEKDVNVFPNPSKGTVNIELTLLNNADVSVNIYDLMGRTVSRVAEGTLEAGNHSFSVPELSPGTYIYSVVSGNDSQKGKLIVE